MSLVFSLKDSGGLTGLLLFQHGCLHLHVSFANLCSICPLFTCFSFLLQNFNEMVVFSWRSKKIVIWLSCYILPSPDSRRAVVSFSRKAVHNYWLTALRTNLSRKRVGRLTDQLDMTLMGWLGCKTSTQSKQQQQRNCYIMYILLYIA